MNKITITGAVIGALIVAAPAVASHRFDDVPTSHPHHAGIDWVATTGITQGCDQNSYCPADPVTRGQMATFLHRYNQQTTGTVVRQHVVTIQHAGVAHCPEGTFVVGGGFQFSGQEQHEVYASYPVTRQEGFNVEGWSVGVNDNGSMGSVITTAVCLEVSQP